MLLIKLLLSYIMGILFQIVILSGEWSEIYGNFLRYVNNFRIYSDSKNLSPVKNVDPCLYFHVFPVNVWKFSSL
ncbi:hypothetical protein GLOIN_2v1598917 [Rhizophagus irregularis DAOM 181602=DAOM 197198]|uniref:Uncharacterized protein n=1 Tax=Rhizophagus irregularis (strain DAOM 181602 / DAOM 197198 / MUCL 43194) TaxID=747089 RepID=A0A2P4Q3D7_RHIID|nr:hypothetical protein GLOIN_2v1598917 [Rhizophagus irregularis DAOM 181602=DAOM 197198]POG72165.1 hypothetical protein GLOIN_2v1598917 [Rhizophagus irregularis DAOM 181602=DAOM 197198]GET59058.1 hypothetical protein GLOIN_2v1598917 [Rhizophagus irregularis DAOM 181602=DAOM 197198]|eukprot:XP_025179031.1 hypothetical protein GLOIN_2v1598917 [Rhizophagus irregularis DAOM 181602=DAOM 197198]